METETIESRVASAILEKPTKVVINGKEYKIGAPSLATLIMVSEIISTLPIVNKTTNDEEKTYSVLHYAKDFKALADIAAVLILGAKNLIQKEETTITKRYLFGLIKRKYKTSRIIDKKAELAKEILLNVSPSQLFDTIINRLKENEVGIFFVITTSLSEANLLAPTKEVETKD